MSLHSLHIASTCYTTSELVIEAATEGLLPQVVKLACSYPYQHSVLGTPAAQRYVQTLAERGQHQGEGWYVLLQLDEVVAAANLSVYGIGAGSGHTLWKIRHPMLAPGAPDDLLAFLLDGLTDIALRLRRGTGKFVIFLSEHEQEALRQASKAEFEPEGCFKDYYRLGETCYVYGRTVF